MKTLILALGCLVFLAACGSTRDRENYGDIEARPNGIILSDPVAHMGGYGRSECLVCHNAVWNLHRDPGSPIDVDALNQQIRYNGEAKYCLSCHGPNGT